MSNLFKVVSQNLLYHMSQGPVGTCAELADLKQAAGAGPGSVGTNARQRCELGGRQRPSQHRPGCSGLAWRHALGPFGFKKSHWLWGCIVCHNMEGINYSSLWVGRGCFLEGYA